MKPSYSCLKHKDCTEIQYRIPKFKFSKKLLLQGPEGDTQQAATQVSSQGCSKVFIVKVLQSVCDFVKGKSLPSIFTFKRELVVKWLQDAMHACTAPTYPSEESYYGGPPFIEADAATHWTEPHQLYTWWKNNVERRNKFRVLLSDAKYIGEDPKKQARARWCETVVALTEIIRSSAGYMNNLRTSYSSVYTESTLAAAAEEAYEESGGKSIRYHNSVSTNSRARSRVSKKRSRDSPEEAPTDAPLKAFNAFPLKIYDLLENLSNSSSSSEMLPISWTSDGAAFRISDPEAFTSSVLRQFFSRSFSFILVLVIICRV